MKSLRISILAMNLRAPLASLVSLTLMTSCYVELKKPPECFESTEELTPNEERLMVTKEIGVSGYCSSDRISCLEIWSGYTEDEIPPEQYAKYPYLSLIEDDPVSEDSPFSLCKLPDRCERPACECVTTDDCSSDEVCIGREFLAGGERGEALTRCLPICDQNSVCQPGPLPQHCVSEDCYLGPTL